MSLDKPIDLCGVVEAHLGEARGEARRTFAVRLARARAQRVISQAQLASALGVSVATVSRWENGHTMPSRAMLTRIEQALSESGARAGDDARAPRSHLAAVPDMAEDVTGRGRASDQSQAEAFLSAVLRGLELGHIKGDAWIRVANECARLSGVDWHVGAPPD